MPPVPAVPDAAGEGVERDPLELRALVEPEALVLGVRRIGLAAGGIDRVLLAILAVLALLQFGLLERRTHYQ